MEKDKPATANLSDNAIKATFPALSFFDTQKFLKNKLKILTKTKNYSIIRQ